jgi:hypothetical protein
MPESRPHLAERARKVPWDEVRRHATTLFVALQAGWAALSEAERREVRELLRKSRGRPRNLSRAEAQRLGRLAGRAATAARRAQKRS